MEKKNTDETSAEASLTGEEGARDVSAMEAMFIHLICGVCLAISFWLAQLIESVNLVSDPFRTLRLICVIECPIVILLYSRYRKNPEQCSYLRAVGRGALALPAGALVNALGAIALGAPVGLQLLPRTVFWSCMMSAFTFVPAASVFGWSWSDWQLNFAYTKPSRNMDYMICIPAHGAVIGAWFGAWPMPLDWERPWQEWPICVSYGALLGYLIGMVASVGFMALRRGHRHMKVD